jgi:DNA (cytosine-5)-methyltransferase 1
MSRASVTIVNPRKAMLLHLEEDRILSVRECSRIQGVDDAFISHGNLNARQQQVANGVPVQLTEAIANAVRNAIQMFNIRSRARASMI